MWPTTALDDNVFDFNALLHPGTGFEHPRGRGLPFEPQPRREARDPGFMGLGCVRDRVVRAPDGLKAPVTIDEILDALCALDGGPRNPPGGKPMRLRSTERRAAA
jgi:hypothetical protein